MLFMQLKEAYAYSVSEIIGGLKSSEAGLTTVMAKDRLKTFGLNVLPDQEQETAWTILAKQMKSILIYILLFAAVISYITQQKIEFAVIVAIVIFTVFIGFFEEYNAAKQMQALKKLTPKIAKVIRNGIKIEIPAEELVPGDIIHVDRGDIVPADSRLMSANNLKADESMLTGESAAVVKQIENLPRETALSAQTNLIFNGTHIINGDGIGVVVRTGKHSYLGHVSQLMNKANETQSPLIKRLDRLSTQVAIAVITLCLFVFVVGILRGVPWVEMAIIASAVAVSGIPESLPTVVAVALSAGVKRMAKKNAIIKKLPAVETLGSTTVICSDKTGTLTQNKMVIEKIFTLDAEVNVTGKGFEPEGVFVVEEEEIDPSHHHSIAKLIEIGVLCNNSSLNKKDDEWHIDGEVTEGALVVLAEKAGIKKEEIHKLNTRLKEHPFDPIRKVMSTVHMKKDKRIAYVKGAPERVLEKCSKVLHNGQVYKITENSRSEILQKNQDFASRGFRVLALAFKEVTGDHENIEHVESDLIFVGLVSIRDPPEDNVRESIEQCKMAGIKVVMITGDSLPTAKAIAKELTILGELDKSISGPELDKLSDSEFMKVVEEITVYARVTPEHKLRIVNAFQSKGHIVAMTGDGVNDAPALKQADIGVAMGRTGTDVAKEAAEIVLKDDNFTTIVKAVEEGRNIYSNIRKFIYYLLVGNLTEVILLVIAVLLGAPLPLTALMYLFLNLVTSDFPAIGLALENVNPNIMKQKPRDPKEGILSDYIMLKIAQLVPFVVLGTLVIFMWQLLLLGEPLKKAQTVTFVALIMFELFHAFNGRNIHESVFKGGIFSNEYLDSGILLSLFFVIVVIYFPPAQHIFGTVPLALTDWIPILLVSSSVLFFMELEKVAVNSEIKERKKLELYPTRKQ